MPIQPSVTIPLARDRAIRHEEREPGDEERREDERHQDAVQRENAIVVEPTRRAEGAGARETLKDAEDGTQGDRGGRGVEVRDDDAILAAYLPPYPSRYRTSILANMF